MPQLDISTYPSQLFWLVVCFGLLYLLLSRLAIPRIATALEERRDRIADELDQAAQMKHQSEEVLAAYEALLARSREEAHVLAQETRHRLQQEAEAQRQKLDAELREKVAEAEERIEESRRQAKESLQTVSTELAGLMLNRLTGSSVPQQRLEESVAVALQQNRLE